MLILQVLHIIHVCIFFSVLSNLDERFEEVRMKQTQKRLSKFPASCLGYSLIIINLITTDLTTDITSSITNISNEYMYTLGTCKLPKQ